jgi:hypothetical protein
MAPRTMSLKQKDFSQRNAGSRYSAVIKMVVFTYIASVISHLVRHGAGLICGVKLRIICHSHVAVNRWAVTIPMCVNTQTGFSEKHIVRVAPT